MRTSPGSSFYYQCEKENYTYVNHNYNKEYRFETIIFTANNAEN